MIAGKVAALITRRVAGVTEVCVFDHAGHVQLPAGTLEPGEDPAAGAMREAWEETGLPHLELAAEAATLGEFDGDERAGVAMLVTPHEGCPVAPGHTVVVSERIGTTTTISSEFYGWTGPVEAACVTRDVTRHVFHLRATAPTPDEWWVLTPDGHGSQWRCRWVPLDGREGIGAWHQRWLDAGRAAIEPGSEVERAAPLPAGATEMFWAPVAGFGGSRAVVVPHEGMRPADGATPGSAGAVCVTRDGEAVVVTEDPTLGWGCPGGRPEGDETPEETLAREVVEEACARVVGSELLVTHEVAELDADGTVTTTRWSPAFWARVEVDEWAPAFEKEHRQLVPLADLHRVLKWEAPPFVRWLDLALDAEARRPD